MSEQGFTLTSPDFTNGGRIPTQCTCDGRGDPPRLSWMHRPEGTASFAIVVEDPDAPQGTFTHWVKFDIPADAAGIAADGGEGVNGKNDFQADGYGGPCPPPNHGRHRYFFRLFALDVPSLGLPSGTKRAAVEAAMQGHVLQQTELMGTYERTTG